MKVSARVRLSGPLAKFMTGFAAELTAQGYTDLSLANQLRLVADLSRWLERGGVQVEELTRELIGHFLAKRRRTHTQRISERGLAPILGYLRQLGSIPRYAARAEPRRGLLGRYEKYLVEERGVGAGHRDYCLTVADELLRDRAEPRWTAADVTALVDAHAGQPAFGSWLSALRSLLRFLFLSGETATNLVYVVPSAPGWRQRSLPRALDQAELDAVLATCDRRTTAGRYDYAALLLMARLGLRAGEVAELKLDDFDWQAGEVVVRGKGTVGRLPLPADVGEAVVAHLRRRLPRHDTRSVFLSRRAPYRGVGSGSISQLARRALRAAGIASGSAHRLRHTAATQMLRKGATLTEIAQVLRHRHIDTTAIYAKVDRDALRSLAQPWPIECVVDQNQLQSLGQPWPRGVA